MEKWVIKNKKGEINALASKFSISNITAKLLCNRGICTDEEVRRFLYPDISSLYSPFEMRGMEKACEIIKQAIADGEKMRIVGDYDVDGVTATHIFLDGLKKLGADVDYRIPDRIKDGYGINENIVRDAANDGVKLLLTCDNGIRAVKEIALAYELGMRVVLTDHHDIPETVPQAEVILNPKYAPCRYPYTELCGAVVVLKLIEALNCASGETSNPSVVDKYLEIAAIATVCDVVELAEENRSIVKLGLKKIHEGETESLNLGIRALMQESRLQPADVNAGSFGFEIGPCINACGRLDKALKGLEMLQATDYATAVRYADELIEINAERKSLTNIAVEKAIDRIIEEKIEDRVLVILLEDCHESLAGIVAGRVREKFDRPTIILTRGMNCLKGSARSIESYNITAELDKCSELLLHYGGHAMAAGMSLDENRFEEFRKRLNDNCTLTPEQMQKKISIDLVMPFQYSSVKLCEEIKLLEPFGTGNPAPLFAERNLEILSVTTIGKNKDFLRFKCKNESGYIFDFPYFGDWESLRERLENCYGRGSFEKLLEGKAGGMRLSITYLPEINEYRGNVTVQARMKNYLI